MAGGNLLTKLSQGKGPIFLLIASNEPAVFHGDTS